MKAAASAQVGDSGISMSSSARRWADFWVSYLMMWAVERNPSLLRVAKPFFTSMAWHMSSYLRTSLQVNARRLLGPSATRRQQALLARRILSNIYDFICDLGTTARMSDGELLARIDEVEGRDRYLRARALKRGAILVTAHLGSFEIGIAALRRDEARVHVVFRRDPMARFERMRAAQRQRLNVVEAPVDDGLSVWVRLRDALMNDEVVLMQGDRVMPGQIGQRIPFLDGHMLVPAGPVKLALATGAPIIPIFAPKTTDSKIRIILEEPILVDADAESDRARHQPHPATLELSQVIERYVRAYPDQWLLVHRALCEDQRDTA